MGIKVHELLRDKFANRTRQEKINIILGGKPRPALESLMSDEVKMPDLKILDGDSTNENSSKFVIVFDSASYDHIDWLTGCEIRQALFCWPCLLFRSGPTNLWTRIGLDNLNNLNQEIKQHETDLGHIQAVLDLQVFSSTIKVEPAAPPLENNNIETNRDIAKQIIDVICYLVTQQQHPRIGSRDKNILEVAENCLENLHFQRHYNMLQQNLIDDTIDKIKKNPKIIADMIEAITNAVRKYVQKELHQSTYVSVILSEHSTERTKSQISTVIRYLKNGEVCERFCGFSNLEGIKTSKMIYQLLKKVIKDFVIFRRAIAYSLDGSILSSIQAFYEVKQELKYFIPHIYFVPCHFHDLDDVLLRSLSFSADCDLFFKCITVVGSYVRLKFDDLENSENSADNLHPTTVKRCSNYAAFLNNIKTHRLSIIDFFDNALRDNEKLAESDVVKLRALRAFLMNFKNYFLLETLLKLFDVVAPVVEALKSSFPGSAFETNLIDCVVDSLDDELQNGAFDPFWWKIIVDFNKQQKGDKYPSSFFERKRKAYHKLFLDIALCMKKQMEFRFEAASKFGFCEILDLESSAKTLKSDQVQALITNYGPVFDYALLDKEIKLVVVNKTAMNSESVHGLYKFFATSGHGSSFSNLNKLCELVLTLPSTIADIACESTRTKLDEIDSWSHTSGKQHGLPHDISFLCVEQDYMKELKMKNCFYDDVICEFREISKTLEIT